jgi:hypothetical protein
VDVHLCLHMFVMFFCWGEIMERCEITKFVIVVEFNFLYIHTLR